jgi:hypothetical protein
MSRKLFSLFYLVFFLVGLAYGVTPSAEKPDVRVGDVWSYRVLDGFTNETKSEISFRLVDVSDSELTARIELKGNPNKGLGIFDRQWNVIDNGQTKYEPARISAKFPMRVGDTWKQKLQASNLRSSQTSYHFVSAKVADFEKVTVPAGTFTAYRIEIEAEIRSADANAGIAKNVVTSWYSPEVNREVKQVVEVFASGRLRDKTIAELTVYAPNKMLK